MKSLIATSTVFQSLAAVSQAAASLFSHPTWDVMLILALLAIAFFSSLRSGRDRVNNRIIATYLALAVYPALPIASWSKSLNISSNFPSQAIGFLVLFAILTLLLSRRGARGRAPAKTWWKIFILNLLQVGLLIHLLLGFLPQDKINLLAPLTRNLFANPNFHIWWLVIPLIFMIVLRRWRTQHEE